ncbi:MAG: Rpn family recombination-promoting nuclease/putative transposase [Desulfovermiculus sp.]|nr:Rpn family recombination-promoting nuclease/putative transposase [Desulfovermiculus sp.]
MQTGVLKYMALQWLELQEQHMLVDGKLPPIIPIVIYQGQDDDRRMCSSFHDLVAMPSEAFKVYIPDFSFAFFNVHGMDEAKVQEKILLKFYVEIIKMQNDPRVKEIPPRLVRGLLESLELRTAVEYIEIFFRYLVKTTGHLSQEDYSKALELLPEGGEKIMETLADQWMEQGAQQERQKAEEWIKQEKPKWVEHGELKNSQETLIDVAGDLYGPLPGSLQEKIKSIQSIDSLRTLTRKVYRIQSLDEFTDLVNRAAQH